MNIWQPQLNGELLTLRPLKETDFEELFQVASDPLIWEQHPDSDRYKREVFLGFFESAMMSGGAFAAYDNVTGKMIGSSRFCDHVPAERSIELGYSFLSRTYWGKSYNREMKTLMLNYAFQYVDKVYFFVGEKNTRSRIAMSRLGGKEWGTEMRTRLNGQAAMSVIYLIDKEHWKNLLKGESKCQVTPTQRM